MVGNAVVGNAVVESSVVEPDVDDLVAGTADVTDASPDDDEANPDADEVETGEVIWVAGTANGAVEAPRLSPPILEAEVEHAVAPNAENTKAPTSLAN